MLPSCSFIYTNKQGGTTDQHSYENLLLKVLANYPRSTVNLFTRNLPSIIETTGFKLKEKMTMKKKITI